MPIIRVPARQEHAAALQPEAELRNGDVGPAVAPPPGPHASRSTPKTGVIGLSHAGGLSDAQAEGDRLGFRVATRKH